MKLAILGVCGTFMAGIASIAKQMGHEVIGFDDNVYPPMSIQLEAENIQLIKGYEHFEQSPHPDVVIVGNAITRGNPALEYILNKKIDYLSGPQWLYQHVLKNRQVIAVSGTHGKTTTTSLLAYVLESAGLNPGFLIGGLAKDFSQTARLGSDPYFVIEADEYDTTFSDKRSKFIHYHPNVLIINNLEFDHADIFSDLTAIKQQFHHLVRIIPQNGFIVYPSDDNNIQEVLKQGCWTPCKTISLQSSQSDWIAELTSMDGAAFTVMHERKPVANVRWTMLGAYNVQNALAVFAVCHHLGLFYETIEKAMNTFSGVKRRLEVRGVANGITFYDDFAHHPTAITKTLQALRSHIGTNRLIAILEFGSYTMRTGIHKQAPFKALSSADMAIIVKPKQDGWFHEEWLKDADIPMWLGEDDDHIIHLVKENAQKGDHVVVLSNTGFAQIQTRLLEAVK